MTLCGNGRDGTSRTKRRSPQTSVIHPPLPRQGKPRPLFRSHPVASWPFLDLDAIWYCCHMAASLLYDEKFVYPDGAVRQMVIWALAAPTTDRPHGLKYRLYYGDAEGRCLVRYDNETGKGDHVHRGEREDPYVFTSVEALVAAFLDDIDAARGGSK